MFSDALASLALIIVTDSSKLEISNLSFYSFRADCNAQLKVICELQNIM